MDPHLGAGNIKLNSNLPDWNKEKSFQEFGDHPLYLLITDDAGRGFVAISGNHFGKDAGKICYL